MDQKEVRITRSAEDTRQFFREFAQILTPGVVGFRGELGAGKTTAIQAILDEFGVAGGESPTFVMIRPYRPIKPKRGISTIFHVDAYRFVSEKDAETTGLRDYLTETGALVLVEWADRIAAFLPPATIWVDMAHKGQDVREITVSR